MIKNRSIKISKSNLFKAKWRLWQFSRRCNQNDLFNATKGCDGKIISASGGGIKCSKCNGWFCY